LIWKIKTQGRVFSSPISDDKGNIYIGSLDGNLYHISPNGKVLWKWKAPDWLFASPTLFCDTLYIGCENNEFFAIDLKGKPLWKFSANEEVFSSANISYDGNRSTSFGFGRPKISVTY